MMKRTYEKDLCGICGGADFIRYPYNDHNRRIKKFSYSFKYYVSRLISPIVKMKIFNPSYYNRIRFIKSGVILLNVWANYATSVELFSPLYDIKRCKKCGYGVYDRQLDMKLLHKYYDTYAPHPFAISSNEYHNESLYLEDIRSIGQYNFVKDELRNFSKINMLEIGAGGALFSRLLRKKHQGQVFLNVVEAMDFWVPYYNELGIKLVGKFFPENEIDQKFQYIHVSGCLLYLYNLFDAIIKLRDLLTDDGLLFIMDENSNSEWYSLDRVDTPTIHSFTKESLAKLMENYNFNVLQLQEYGLTHKEQYMKEKDPDNFDKKILEDANLSVREKIPREGGNLLRGLFSLRKNVEITP